MTCAVDSAISQIFVLVCLFGIEGDNALFFLFSFTDELNISIYFLGLLCCFTVRFWTRVWGVKAVDASFI